jgi:exopolysaccharide biosynthesis protein
MSHQYLAHLFYSEKTIEEVMARNFVIEVDEETDPSLIDMEKENIKPDTYESFYEEQILKKDHENDNYKVIDISGNNYRGYLTVIYDPSKFHLATTRYLSKRGENLDAIAQNNDAVLAINASGFEDPNLRGNGGSPTGSVVKDGKIIWTSPRPSNSGGVIGFTKDNQLILTKESMGVALTKYNLRDAIEFGPFLIVNGKPSFIRGNGGWGVAPRTSLAQRQDGIILLLTIDGRRPGYSIGADMVDLTEILTRYKAYNAVNLDGGSSTGLFVIDHIVNRPVAATKTGLRAIPDAWIMTK